LLYDYFRNSLSKLIKLNPSNLKATETVDTYCVIEISNSNVLVAQGKSVEISAEHVLPITMSVVQQ